MSDKLTRVERDSIGEMNIPVEAYYGVQSMRALENFLISGYHLRPEMIDSLAEVKKACAIAALANTTARPFSDKNADTFGLPLITKVSKLMK